MSDLTLSNVRKIAITGGLGFIGSNLTRALVSQGWHVIIIDKHDRVNEESPFEKCELRLGVDLTDPKLAASALEDVEICIALAGNAVGVVGIEKWPASLMADHLAITLATFRACLSNKIRHIIYISSSSVYNGFTSGIIEDIEPEAVNVPPAGYPFSKLACEVLARTFQIQYGLPYTIIRPFNVYGPGEYPSEVPGIGHVIPDLTRKLSNDENPVTLIGDGNQTRSFTYIDDIVAGISLCIDNDEAINCAINLGSPDETSIRELASLIWNELGIKEELKFEFTPSPIADISRRALRSDRASQLLGWIPRTTLTRGIRKYVQWYLASQMGAQRNATQLL